MISSIKRVKLLTMAMTKNSTADADPFKHKGLKASIGIIGSSIMLACAASVGYFTYLLTQAVGLINVNAQGTEAAQLIMYFISIFGAVFGVNVICGWLYFSTDLSRLFPYPFKPNEICMSKFVVAYFQESIMEFLVIIGIMVGYMAASGLSILGVIFALAGVVLLPVLPLFYCALISMAVMSLIKKIGSNKGVHLVSALCGVAFALLFMASLLQLDNITAESFIISLANGTNVFMNTMQYVFFTVPLLCGAVSQQSILLFLGFVAVHIAMWLVLDLLASKLYVRGVSAVMSSGKKHIYADVKSKKRRSGFASCLQRDVKTLLRTQTYITNCIVPNAILPVVGLVILCTGLGKNINELLCGMKAPQALVVIAVMVLSILVTAMNGISSSSFTREGNHADLLKYIPVPYKEQIKAKTAVSFMFSMPFALVGVVLICASINADFLLYIYCLVGSALAVAAAVYSGILFDALHPKLVWDDELSALRGNMSTFLHMAAAIAAGAVITAAYFIFSNVILIPVVLGMFLILAVILAVYVPKRTVQLITEMDI